MKHCTKVLPGRPGSKKLLAIYGAKLFCVRYRYDDILRRRTKTIELVVETGSWKPTGKRAAVPRTVQVRSLPHEVRLHDAIRRAGGRWDECLAVWNLSTPAVRELGLTDRVVRRSRHPRRISSWRKN